LFPLVFLLMGAPSGAQLAPVGGELTVAQAPVVFHRSPAVAAGELGNFVVVWQRHAGGSEGWDVLARLYDRSGAPLGPELVVNTTTAGCQQAPAVAASSAGNVSIYPGDVSFPMTSTVNVAAGQTRANNAIAGLSRDGLATLTARASLAAGVEVNLILDVNGYFE
jgi:hypothetical protein